MGYNPDIHFSSLYQVYGRQVFVLNINLLVNIYNISIFIRSKNYTPYIDQDVDTLIPDVAHFTHS